MVQCFWRERYLFGIVETLRNAFKLLLTAFFFAPRSSVPELYRVQLARLHQNQGTLWCDLAKAGTEYFKCNPAPAGKVMQTLNYFNG
jgi:hypothetical protein